MIDLREPTAARPCRQRSSSRGVSSASRARVARPRAMRHARPFGIALLGAAACMLSYPAAALDVNTATVEQLQEMRGLGPKTARVILSEKARGGNFESLDDLSERVRGIGEKKKRALETSGLTAGGRVKPHPGERRIAPAAGRPAAGTPVMTDGTARSIPFQRPDTRARPPRVRRPR
jgi:competence protein ComEA